MGDASGLRPDDRPNEGGQPLTIPQEISRLTVVVLPLPKAQTKFSAYQLGIVH